MAYAIGQTWLGTLPTWLTVAGVIAVGWFFVRGAGGTALTTLETANRVLENANKALETRVHVLETQAIVDQKLIAELKARTDLSVQLVPIIKWTGEHDARDQERFEKTILVLGEIADRLSPGTGSGLEVAP